MAWKIERWAQLFGRKNARRHYYHNFSFRELVIVAAAELDAGLADLLSRRLSGEKAEVISFIGADADGRSPAGTFGARIQLAHIVGILDADTLPSLRAIKNLRNRVAHRVRIPYRDTEIQKHLAAIRDGMKGFYVDDEPLLDVLRPIWPHIFHPTLGTKQNNGSDLVGLTLEIYCTVFRDILAKVSPIRAIKTSHNHPSRRRLQQSSTNSNTIKNTKTMKVRSA